MHTDDLPPLPPKWSDPDYVARVQWQRVPDPMPTDSAPRAADIPGYEGSVGPGPGQYAALHVYARSVQSGAANCVCGRDPWHVLHVPTPFAPGGYLGPIR
jgi:hypothetical protein